MIDPKDKLVRYARTGCESAFSHLVNYYGSLVVRSAQRRVMDFHLAEEVVQNVFATLAKKAAKVSEYHSISAWLHETTRRESAKVLRSQIRHERRVKALKKDQDAMTMSDPQAQNLRDLLPHLEEALDSLKSSERQILLARFFDEDSFRDIAKKTGKSESACKMRLSRSLEKLNLILSRRGITFSAATLGMLLQTEWAKAAPSLPVVSLSALQDTSPLTTALVTIKNTKVLMMVVLALLVAAAISVTLHQQKTLNRSSAHSSSSITGGSSSESLSPYSALRDVKKKAFIETHQFVDLENFVYLLRLSKM